MNSDPWWLPSFEAHLSAWLKACLGLMLPAWAIRYNHKLDLPMNWRAGSIRWSIVLAFFALASLPTGAQLLRIAAASVALIFAVWPNFAVHIEKRIWPEAQGQTGGGVA
jgi:hypothetical protein